MGTGNEYGGGVGGERKMEETHQHKRLLIIQQFNHKAHKKTTS